MTSQKWKIDVSENRQFGSIGVFPYFCTLRLFPLALLQRLLALTPIVRFCQSWANLRVFLPSVNGKFQSSTAVDPLKEPIPLQAH